MGVMKLHGANETLAAARRAVAASAAAGAARVLGQRAEEGGTGPDAPAEGAEGAAGAAGEPAGAARAVLRVEREFGAAGGGARLRMINDCVGLRRALRPGVARALGLRDRRERRGAAPGSARAAAGGCGLVQYRGQVV